MDYGHLLGGRCGDLLGRWCGVKLMDDGNDNVSKAVVTGEKEVGS